MSGYIGKSQGVTQVDGYTRDEADAEHTGTQTFNRTSTDGDIVTLQKDGTTVGSIGNRGSTVLQIHSNSGAGIDFGGSQFNPLSGSSLTDASIDIGQPSFRFQDLYLSGGVYLGGTGSANYLDDYETGTWTPGFQPTGTGFDSITYDTDPNGVIGKYTKIGDMVAVYFRLRTDAVTIGSASGYLQVTGLPFTTDSVYMGAVGIGYANAWTNAPKGLYIQTSSTKLFVSERSAADGNDSLTAPNDMTTGGNGNQIMCSFVYRTNL